MITPHLENLIWQGKARVKTWNIGGAGVSRIPVTKNTFIVITDILWNPFIDERLQDGGFDVKQLMQIFTARCLHSLLLYTSKSKHMFNLRDQVNLIPSPNFVIDNGVAALNTSRPYNIPTYLIFDENVRVDILKTDNQPSQWVNSDYSAMPDDSDEINLEEGYMTASSANVLPTLKNWHFANAADSAINPNADQTPIPAVLAGDANYQYQGKSEPGRALLNPIAFPQANSTGYSTPLVTFQYVEVFQPLPKNLIL